MQGLVQTAHWVSAYSTREYYLMDLATITSTICTADAALAAARRVGVTAHTTPCAVLTAEHDGSLLATALQSSETLSPHDAAVDFRTATLPANDRNDSAGCSPSAVGNYYDAGDTLWCAEERDASPHRELVELTDEQRATGACVPLASTWRASRPSSYSAIALQCAKQPAPPARRRQLRVRTNLHTSHTTADILASAQVAMAPQELDSLTLVHRSSHQRPLRSSRSTTTQPLDPTESSVSPTSARRSSASGRGSSTLFLTGTARPPLLPPSPASTRNHTPSVLRVPKAAHGHHVTTIIVDGHLQRVAVIDALAFARLAAAAGDIIAAEAHSAIVTPQDTTDAVGSNLPHDSFLLPLRPFARLLRAAVAAAAAERRKSPGDDALSAPTSGQSLGRVHSSPPHVNVKTSPSPDSAQYTRGGASEGGICVADFVVGRRGATIRRGPPPPMQALEHRDSSDAGSVGTRTGDRASPSAAEILRQHSSMPAHNTGSTSNVAPAAASSPPLVIHPANSRGRQVDLQLTRATTPKVGKVATTDNNCSMERSWRLARERARGHR